MCAGIGSRWGQSTPKQLELIQRKPNLLRTHNMLVSMGISEKDIYVTVNSNNKKYFPKDLNLIIGSSIREIDRFRNGFNILDNSDKTIFLYGDVVYHPLDLKTILNGKGYCFFGRIGANEITDKIHGEIFGVITEHPSEFKDDVNMVAYMYEQKLISREIAWEVLNLNQNKSLKTYVELSKLTDDYDDIFEYKKVLRLLRV